MDRADEMKHDAEELEERIEDTRSDWESKKKDSAVPGAQAPDEQEESADVGVESGEQAAEAGQ